MPYELVFTSAPRGANIGSSGYCTVGQTKGVSQDITLALEKTGVYHHVADPGSGSNPTVYSYRMLDIRGETYYVLSQIRDAGLDYTNRSNYLAHHLVFDSREIDNLPSPAAILLHWNGWITSWGNQQPGYWEPTRFTQSNLNQLPKILGIAKYWQAKTGDAANAAGLMEYPPSQPVYWSCNVGEEAEMVQLFAEALQLADPTGQSFIEAWNYTFTTFLQQGDQPGQFVWRGVVPGTPAFQTAQQSGQAPQLLTQVRDPGNDRSKFAKTGQPQSQAAPPKESPPDQITSAATAGATSRLKRTLPGGSSGSLSRPKKRKRSVTAKQPSNQFRKRKVKDLSQKWMYIGGGIIGACVLLVMFLLVSAMFDGDDGDNGGVDGTIAGIDQNETETGQNKNNVGDSTGNGGKKGGLGIGALIGGTPKEKGNGGKEKTPKQATANPKLYEFVKKNRVYLVPTVDGQAGFRENDAVLKDLHLGAFFKALKVHYNANKIETNPAPLEAATWAEGPNPMGLKADISIPYISNGGTQTRPVQYDLGPMTALASSLNPASKPAGVYFQFRQQRQWIHIQGKDIEPFYLVPLETGRYPALVTLKVAKGIVFDDGTMTATVDPKIIEAITKLLMDNKASKKVELRAGAPLATWGLAHVNTTDTIDFKQAHLDQQIKMAGTLVTQLKSFVKVTDYAIRDLFPAANAVAEARAKAEAADPDMAHLNKVKQVRNRALAKADKVMRRYDCYRFFERKTLEGIWKSGRNNDGRGGKAIMEMNALFLAATDDPNFKDPNDPLQIISKSDYIMQKCGDYFLAEDEVVFAQETVDGNEEENKLMRAEIKRQEAAYGKISVLYLGKGSPVPGLDAFKANLAKDAGQIMLGNTTLDTTKTRWEKRKENMPVKAGEDLAMWNGKPHQQAEWERFKKHQVFYLGGKVGLGSTTVLSLVEFNQ